MFCFLIKAEPTAENSSAADIGGASVNTWVKADSMDQAKFLAETYFAKFGWKVLAYEMSLEPTENQINKLGPDEHENYENGLRFGISTFFSAWPKKERTEDGIVELRHMTPLVPIGKQGMDC